MLQSLPESVLFAEVHLLDIFKPSSSLFLPLPSHVCPCHFLLDGVRTYLVVDYEPVYYQACKDASPLRSSVDVLSMVFFLGPSAVVTGVGIKKLQCYRPQIWIGWVLTIVSLGSMTIIRADTPKGISIVLSGLNMLGSGTLYGESIPSFSTRLLILYALAAVYFPILSPLPVTENALALVFHGFCRSFASVCVAYSA